MWPPYFFSMLTNIQDPLAWLPIRQKAEQLVCFELSDIGNALYQTQLCIGSLRKSGGQKYDIISLLLKKFSWNSA